MAEGPTCETSGGPAWEDGDAASDDAVVVTAAPVVDARIPDDARTAWTVEGVRDYGEVEDSVPAPGRRRARGGDRSELAACSGSETGPVVLASLLLLLGGGGPVLLARRRTD